MDNCIARTTFETVFSHHVRRAATKVDGRWLLRVKRRYYPWSRTAKTATEGRRAADAAGTTTRPRVLPPKADLSLLCRHEERSLLRATRYRSAMTTSPGRRRTARPARAARRQSRHSSVPLFQNRPDHRQRFDRAVVEARRECALRVDGARGRCCDGWSSRTCPRSTIRHSHPTTARCVFRADDVGARRVSVSWRGNQEKLKRLTRDDFDTWSPIFSDGRYVCSPDRASASPGGRLPAVPMDLETEFCPYHHPFEGEVASPVYRRLPLDRIPFPRGARATSTCFPPALDRDPACDRMLGPVIDPDWLRIGAGCYSPIIRSVPILPYTVRP